MTGLERIRERMPFAVFVLLVVLAALILGFACACYGGHSLQALVRLLGDVDLRHDYASILVAEGLSLPIIGALLGHAKPQTTARYAHVDFEYLARAYQHHPFAGDVFKPVIKAEKK